MRLRAALLAFHRGLSHNSSWHNVADKDQPHKHNPGPLLSLDVAFTYPTWILPMTFGDFAHLHSAWLDRQRYSAALHTSGPKIFNLTSHGQDFYLALQSFFLLLLRIPPLHSSFQHSTVARTHFIPLSSFNLFHSPLHHPLLPIDPRRCQHFSPALYCKFSSSNANQQKSAASSFLFATLLGRLASVFLGLFLRSYTW